jgi:predicted nucleic acid-binding protein
MHCSPRTAAIASETVGAVYLDTSALGRVLLDEPDKRAIKDALDDFERVVASRLLRIELRRVALKRGLLDRAESLLADISLVPLDDRILTATETLAPASVGALDAIHLATAVQLAGAGKLNAVMTYDKGLAAGAREHGIAVLSPS